MQLIDIEKKLEHIIEYAYNNSTYYKKHLGDTSCFYDVPFTDENTLRMHGSEMLCTSLSKIERIRTFQTSGTLSAPKRMYFSKGDQLRTTEFFKQGMKPILGDSKTVFILMSEDSPGSIASLLRTALNKLHVEGIIYGRPTTLEDIKDLPLYHTTIVGLPDDVLYISAKLPKLRPTSVLLSADYISPYLIKNIENTWHCPVYAHYGLTETCYGLAVQKKPKSDMLLREKDFFLEIIDPMLQEALPYNTPGEIVITTMQESALPLLRYRTGDMGVMSGPGRLSHVYGRIANLAQEVNIHKLSDLIYSLPNIAGFYAELKEGILHLLIDGDKIPSDFFYSIPIPTIVTYGDAMPFAYGGKKKLHLTSSF